MNIVTILRRTATDHAGHVAIRIDDTAITYRELLDRVQRFGAYLHSAGIVPGDRVGILLPNGPDYVVGVFGAWCAGAIAVPLNSMFPDAPLRYAIEDSGVRLVVTGPEEVERIRRVGGGDLALLETGPGGRMDAALAATEPRPRVVPRLDEDEAVVMYTSGSTGVPKGVRHTHRNLAAHADAVIDFHELTPHDHVLNCMPLFHVGGLHLLTLPILLRGGQLTFMPRWDVDRWLELAQTLKPTYGGLISTMMIDVGNRTVSDPVDLSSFRVCLFGGSRTPTAALHRLEHGTGIRATEMYGQTEQNGLAVSYRPGEKRRLDSMGVPLEQVVQTRIVSVDTGRDVDPASTDVGELWVRGDAVTPGYWNLDAPDKWSDGWLHTGDLVHKDEDGYLYYVDRVDDMIISGGENVFPQMVEEHLASHPGLAEVAVIGTAHDRWVQQVTAIVVVRDSALTADDIAQWCAENPNLTGMHKPKRIEIVAAIPRTGTGKINRPELKRMFV
jgi:long-chain acyl-CoA synthetase